MIIFATSLKGTLLTSIIKIAIAEYNASASVDEAKVKSVNCCKLGLAL